MRQRLTTAAADPLWRWVVPAALTMLAAVLLFVRLDEPGRIVFDETYYVDDAREYLDQGVEESFAVHPPVGKWLIAGSIALLGDGPLGWRAAGALAGSLVVLLTYLIGSRLFRHVGDAALAALLLATDGLFFVQARISMLDIHLALFVVLGAYLLLVDHDRAGLGRAPPTWPVPAGGSSDEPGPVAVLPAAAPEAATRQRPLPARGHGVRVLAGVAFGLAVATKWSGLLALGAAVVLVVGWELSWRRRWTGRWFAGWPRLVASVGIALALVPVAVYLVSYVPWFVNYPYSYEGQKECADDEGRVQDPCDVGVAGKVAGFWRYQRAIADFHQGLEATHTYRAPALTWPVMARPVVYYWETCSEERARGVPQTDEDGEVTEPEPCVVAQGEAAEILAVGNPALWWGFLAATPLLVAALVRRRRAAAFVAVFYAAQFVPWLLVTRPVFLFYMVPVVPFLALGLAYACSLAGERWPVAATFAGAALGGAGAFGGTLLVAGAVDADATTARWIALGTGWILGAAVGGVLDLRSGRRPRALRRPHRSPGSTVGIAVAVLAVTLFVYFLPVWSGIPLPEDTVRQRWWFDSWI